MIIWNKPPIILTQDRDWLEQTKDVPMLKSGMISSLPDDAILIFPDMSDQMVKMINSPVFVGMDLAKGKDQNVIH